MPEINLTLNRKNCKLFVYRFCPLFLIPVCFILAASYWVYYEENLHDQQLLKQQQQHNLQLLKNHFQQELKSVITDLRFLSEQNELKQLINQQSDPAKARTNLAKEYQAFSQFKGKYDQVRYIGIDGQEQVRVNLTQGYATITADKQLQNKSKRYYFSESIALNKGEIHVSTFDLNIENGSIETPFKPVIRLSSPIFNTDNQVSGFVILNFLGQQLLDTLSDTPNSSSKHLLINQQGYWLKGLKVEDEWGHMYPDRRTKTLSEYFPEAWETIQKSTKAQFHTSSGLFAYTNINPSASHNSLVADNKNKAWILISYIPQQVFDAHTAKLRQQFIIFDILFALFWFISCTFISKNKLQKDFAQKQILDRDELLINILSTAFDSIITINQRGIIETFNPAACRMFGYQEHEALGNKINMLMSTPHREFHDSYLRHFIDTEQAKILGIPTQVMALHKDGREFPVDICIGAKKFKGEWSFTGIIRDCAQLQELEQELAEISKHDELLKACYNRQYFYQHLKNACNQALLTNTELSIILIDIDNFHQINEQYDYQAGDCYLHSITTLLLEIIEDQGSLARYADNTFIILLPECGAKDAQKNAEQIKAEVESHHIIYQQQKINRKAVTGIATLQEAGINNANQLLHAADKSLALNKQSCRL